MTPQRAREWLTLVPIVLGSVLLIFSATFYAFTLHTDGLIVSSGGTLITAGLGIQGFVTLRKPADPPDATDPPARDEAS